MSDFVERRYATIVDALNTEDKRGRGYIGIDRCLELYLLYFNASVGELLDHELAAFVEPFTHDAPERTLPGAPKFRVIDYMAFAAALAKRDQQLVDEKITTMRLDANAPGPPFSSQPTQRQRSPGGTRLSRGSSPPQGRTRHHADGTGHRLPALSPLGVQEAALVREEIRPPDKLEQIFGRRPRTSLGNEEDTALRGSDVPPHGSTWSGREDHGQGSPPVLKPTPNTWGRRYGGHGSGGGGDSWGSDAGEPSPLRRSSGDSWGGSSSGGAQLGSNEGWGDGGAKGAAVLTRALAAADGAGTGSMLQAYTQHMHRTCAAFYAAYTLQEITAYTLLHIPRICTIGAAADAVPRARGGDEHRGATQPDGAVYGPGGGGEHTARRLPPVRLTPRAEPRPQPATRGLRWRPHRGGRSLRGFGRPYA